MPTTHEHPRFRRAVRRTVKWGGAGLTVLLVVVWIGSGWWGLYYFNGNHGVVTVQGGQLLAIGSLRYSPAVHADHFWFDPQPSMLYWWFEWGTGAGRNHYSLPLWPLPLLSLLATAAAWRVEAKYLRRAREGACPACGYDRAGLAAGAVCPECGGCGGGTIEQMAAQP